MVGDLINFSPCLKIIKDNKKDSHITLVCSEYNYQIAKNYYYVDKFIIFKKNKIFTNIFSNLKTLFFTNYKYLFQFDGNKSSYYISYFIHSKIRSTICFVKYKKIFGIDLQIFRPLKIFLRLFYTNYLYCDERYEEDYKKKSPVHYQTNYFNILKQLNFNITDRQNLFFLDKSYENKYNYFFNNFINSPFNLFHFDEKWNSYKLVDFENALKIIYYKSKKNKLIITTGLKDFLFFDKIKNKYTVFNFINDEFIQENINKNNVLVLRNLPLNLLAYFIKNSDINLSSHSGPVVHISPTFDRQIIDLIPKSKNEELDRWIPAVSKYKRINFEDLNDEIIENI